VLRGSSPLSRLRLEVGGKMVLRCCGAAVLRLRVKVKVKVKAEGGPSCWLNHPLRFTENGYQKFFTVRSRDLGNKSSTLEI
jgi:hypothetical protein